MRLQNTRWHCAARMDTFVSKHVIDLTGHLTSWITSMIGIFKLLALIFSMITKHVAHIMPTAYRQSSSARGHINPWPALISHQVAVRPSTGLSWKMGIKLSVRSLLVDYIYFNGTFSMYSAPDVLYALHWAGSIISQCHYPSSISSARQACIHNMSNPSLQEAMDLNHEMMTKLCQQ